MLVGCGGVAVCGEGEADGGVLCEVKRRGAGQMGRIEENGCERCYKCGPGRWCGGVGEGV